MPVYCRQSDGHHSLTKLRDLSVEGAAHRPAVERQAGQTVMADGVAAEQQPRYLVSLEREDVFTDPTLQHLKGNTDDRREIILLFTNTGTHRGRFTQWVVELVTPVALEVNTAFFKA